ncbi:M13 family metallopeptidase [bacterium]|nr:M13 family metallopeptidase [bacterium]
MTHPYSLKKSLAHLGLALLLSIAATAEPSQSGLDLNNLDRSANPAQDFFQYANGGWLKANPIPSDKPRWGTFNKLLEENQDKLHTILEEQAKNPSDAEGKKLGYFYTSGMTEAGQAAGINLVKQELDELAKTKDLQGWLTQRHRQACHPYFSFGSAQDSKDSSLVIGQLNQGGLGLPESEYYTRTDEKSQKIREQYQAFLVEVFKKWGDDAATAEKKAKQVFELETRLARASMTLVQQRDPKATYHPVSVAQLAKEAPGLDWPRYFKELGAPALKSVNISSPKFFKLLGAILKTTPLEAQRAYLQWNVLRKSADYLTEDWAQLFFGFYGKTLTGAQEITTRWRRVVKEIDGDMGDALGHKYVDRHFPPAAKAKVEDMLKNIRGALKNTINELEWMTPETKKAAQEKLASFHQKIGYPERWRNYASLSISPGNYLANVQHADAFEVQRDLKKIGKPMDHNEWYMTPPTVNAYYDPQNNEIVFPAGILQPPFFSMEADDSVNYGALGVVIGHEITHGFDDQGAQFDPKGNLRNWWKPEDLKKFQALSKAIVDQFSGYEVAPGLHIQGKLVVGESIADLGGLKLAWEAYQASQAGKTPKTLDGFTPEQRFFLAYARIWAMNMRDEYVRLQVNTDPHPNPRFRVNGPLSNMPEFQKAFQIPENSPMVRNPRNRVW